MLYAAVVIGTLRVTISTPNIQTYSESMVKAKPGPDHSTPKQQSE